MVMTSAPIIAHQGGWDEALMIAGPIVVVGWLLWVAKRRIRRAAENQPAENQPADQATADTQTPD